MRVGSHSLVTLVVSPGELPIDQRVWGTGGWLAPEEREGLDWLTLCRLMGWEVNIQRSTEWNVDQDSAGACGTIILACPPNQLDDQQIDALAARLNTEPVLIVARAGADENKFATLSGATAQGDPISGQVLSWRGPGTSRQWNCRKSLRKHRRLQLNGDTEVWAILEEAPLIAARKMALGLSSMNLHPSHARDMEGAVTALLKHLLVSGFPGATAWLDLENTLILRMDDPGGAKTFIAATGLIEN